MPKYKEITVEDAKDLLNKENAILFDIRDSKSYFESHAENAINLNNENIGAFINANADRKQTIIIMCYHGNSSKQVAEYFTENGFENVYSVIGGYALWSI